MIYHQYINTPANTYASGPQITRMDIGNGLIYKVEIFFPPGSAGLLGVWIMDGDHQLWPTERGTKFKGDNRVYSFEDIYLKDQPPFCFDIYTYNFDDTYSHMNWITIGMVSKEVYMARFLPSVGYDDFIAKLKQLSKEQQEELEAKNQEILEKPLSWLPASEEE